MTEFQIYEYTVKPQTKGLWLRRKIGAIILYFVFAAVYFVISGLLLDGALFYPMLFALPLILFGIILFSWKYTKVEFEFQLEGDTLKISEIYGKSARKKKLEVAVRDFIEIAPYTADSQEHVESFAPEKDFLFFSSLDSPALCYGLFKGAEDKLWVVYFDVTDEMVRRLRRLNPTNTKELTKIYGG